MGRRPAENCWETLKQSIWCSEMIRTNYRFVDTKQLTIRICGFEPAGSTLKCDRNFLPLKSSIIYLCFKVVLPRGSMTFSKNEIWTGYFTSSAKNILEKVRNWTLCVFLLVIVWKTMIFQHKTIPKSMEKSMKSWFFTKIHQKSEISKKIFFRPIFLHFIKIFMAKFLILCRCRFVSAFDSWYF